jgi:low affinity Fe/Cu permease
MRSNRDASDGLCLEQGRRQASTLHFWRSMTQTSLEPRRDRWHRMLAAVRRQRRPFGAGMERLSSRVTGWAGSSLAFMLAFGVVLAWAVTGPLFDFSNTWQLVINTGTTIVTFLMVFLIQRSQNKDAVAIHLKLNEIVAALQGASNRLINVEDLTEGEVRMLHRHYGRLAELSRENGSLTESHSIEQAVTRHASKHGRRRRPATAPPRAS